jgi:acetylornithine/succinyldiaminopimelate/putrescine aminotransferase
MHTFTSNPILGHITTFGGHPLSCSAALAGIKFLKESNLVQDIERKHQLFRSLLVHESIKEIRGIGFMLAIQLESFEFNKKVIDECIANGVITDWFLHCTDAMRIAPPLIISDDEIKLACEVILKALDKVTSN